jgi:hypothetical protein
MIPDSYFTRVCAYFRNDAKKAWAWFDTRNPSLSMMSPMELIRDGRKKRLMKFIDDVLSGKKKVPL